MVKIAIAAPYEISVFLVGSWSFTDCCIGAHSKGGGVQIGLPYYLGETHIPLKIS